MQVCDLAVADYDTSEVEIDYGKSWVFDMESRLQLSAKYTVTLPLATRFKSGQKSESPVQDERRC